MSNLIIFIKSSSKIPGQIYAFIPKHTICSIRKPEQTHENQVIKQEYLLFQKNNNALPSFVLLQKNQKTTPLKRLRSATLSPVGR
jgi:hypothetical protein